MPYKLLGIDPSLTNTAVVVLDSSGKLEYFDQSKSLRFSRADPLYRLQGIRDMVLNLCPVGMVFACYEDYSYGSTGKVFQLGELGGVLKLALYSRVESLTLVSPSSLKQFATTNGSALKEEMQRKAYTECPELDGESDDVCDAYFLAKFAWFAHHPKEASASVELTRHRLEVVKRQKYVTYSKGA